MGLILVLLSFYKHVVGFGLFMGFVDIKKNRIWNNETALCFNTYSVLLNLLFMGLAKCAVCSFSKNVRC